MCITKARIAITTATIVHAFSSCAGVVSSSTPISKHQIPNFHSSYTHLMQLYIHFKQKCSHIS